MDFLSTWGWLILGVLFIVALSFARRRAGLIVPFLLAGAALYYFAGFNLVFFNPRELHMETALAFLTGALFGWWGWLLFLATIFCMFPLVERQREGWSFALLAVSAVLLYVLIGWNIFLAVLHHPILALIVFMAYVGAGAGWSWFKFGRYIDEKLVARTRAEHRFIEQWKRALTEDLDTDRSSSGSSQGQGFSASANVHVRSAPARDQRERNDLKWAGMKHDTTPEALTALKRSMLESLSSGKIPDELVKEWFQLEDSKKARLLDNKERIVNWMMFWPWSALSYFLFDLLREFFEEVWRRMSAIYQAVIDRKYAGIDVRLINPAPSDR